VIHPPTLLINILLQRGGPGRGLFSTAVSGLSNSAAAPAKSIKRPTGGLVYFCWESAEFTPGVQYNYTIHWGTHADLD